MSLRVEWWWWWWWCEVTSELATELGRASLLGLMFGGAVSGVMLPLASWSALPFSTDQSLGQLCHGAV